MEHRPTMEHEPRAFRQPSRVAAAYDSPARKRWVRHDKEPKPREGRHQRDAGVSPERT
jgi:hypothetical protein